MNPFLSHVSYPIVKICPDYEEIVKEISISGEFLIIEDNYEVSLRHSFPIC